jgi:hypothetical protein
MSREISEADWRTFRELRSIALERFSQRVLSDVVRLATETDKSSHERYRAVFGLIQRRDRELADAFNDLRRSTAVRRLACIQSHELLTEEELARFSAETRETVEFLVASLRAD